MAEKWAVISTKYENFGSPLPKNGLENVRARLSFQTIREALKLGVGLMIMDDGSSNQYLQAVQKIIKKAEKAGKNDNIFFYADTGSRVTSKKRGLDEIERITGGDADIALLDPEKAGCLTELEKNKAWSKLEKYPTVVVGRTPKSLNSYPAYQRESESTGNIDFIKLCSKYGYCVPALKNHFDSYFGARLVRMRKNTNEDGSRFYRGITYTWGNLQCIPETVIRDMWAESLFTPLLFALHFATLGYVEVPYLYPKTQRAYEHKHPKHINGKRKSQKNTIYYISDETAKALHGLEKSNVQLAFSFRK